jgi:bis(5'-nucleosyl)-tetraphosphatase (symmetrical)
MALYLIGDIQGCDEALQRLLIAVSFSPSRDTLYLLGDMVNRGPDSAGVLRRLMRYGHAAQCILGNHDLHLLAVSVGARKLHRKDTLSELLTAPDCDMLLTWLRQQPLARLLTHRNHDYLLVHAGVLPAWTAHQCIALAGEVERVLHSTNWPDFLHRMYGNQPDHWDASWSGDDRLRVIVNALTRLRFCTASGQMEFSVTLGADAAPPGYLPWFDVPGRHTANVRVAFGHWSTLGWLGREDVISLDSGCVWGGRLTALRLDDSQPSTTPQLIQVGCTAAQHP